MLCAVSMFSSSLEIGIYKFRSKASMTRDRSTVKIVYAAFSKSVKETSIGLNSVRHPMLSCLGGGALNLTVFQLVDWMFYIVVLGGCSVRVQSRFTVANVR